MTGRPAVFLDRDGVLNRAVAGSDGVPRPPSAPSEVELLPGVQRACGRLRALGFTLVMVTNQPDVARGSQSRNTVEAINRLVQHRLRIDAVRSCFHDDADQCECRKPRPGLLMEASRDLDLDLRSSYMVGDRWRDIEAGRRAGCATILVGSGYGERPRVSPDISVPSLSAAASWIAERSQPQLGETAQ